jgi:hypothetical protein
MCLWPNRPNQAAAMMVKEQGAEKGASAAATVPRARALKLRCPHEDRIRALFEW